jgi:arginyl-tRNA synthetase
MGECLSACARLRVNVTSEHNAGESSYADELAPMVEDLVAREVAEPDQGALIIRLDTPTVDGSGRPLFEPIKEPCLVRKTDGGYLYATTDIAAVRRRVRTMKAHRLIYAIDARQALHMKQVFAAAIRAGYAIHPDTLEPARMDHAAFGSVMGEDGRPFKTRSGDSVHLAQLIDETMQRAHAAVTSNDSGLTDLKGDEATQIAEAVGVAALKYADLANNRTLDYAFSFDRMLAFEGNTGPYLLYALVRIRSIFAKGAAQGVGDAWQRTGFAVSEPAEKALAMTLLKYPAVVHNVAETLEPHRLCQFLYDLAGAFSTFYAQCPVLVAKTPELRDQRMRLCDLTAKVLTDGLATIGIPTISRM